MAEMADVDAFLEHAGVKGMKWGKRKAAQASGESGPSMAKAIAFGSYGAKSGYKNAQAAKNRSQAGKLKVAAISTALAGVAVTSLAGRSGNPSVRAGASIVAGLLQTTGAGLGAASAIKGITAVNQENKSRQQG